MTHFHSSPLRLVVAALLTALATLVADARGTRAQEPATVMLVDGGWAGAALERRNKDGKDMRGTRLAAVVIRLQPGWKTYWRVPGEGGAPPRFDFSASRNVREARVLYPAPQRFADPITGKSIGYAQEVAFPLLVRFEDERRPARLRLKMDYAVCGKMCIPLQAETALDIDPATPPAQATRDYVLAWMKRTPMADDGGIVLESVRLKGKAPTLSLEVELRGKGTNRITDILVEGVDMALFDPAVRDEAGNAGKARFRIPVYGLARERDFRGARLRLTILKGETAIEREITLP